MQASFFRKFFHKDPDKEGEEISLRANGVYRDRTIYDIVLNETSKVIGYCDLRYPHDENHYYFGNIGYRIYAPYRGHNYAYKACLMLFDIAREEGMDYMIITCSPENEASRRICEKLNGRFIEQVDVPEWHQLYRQGEKVKNIYRYDLHDE